MAAPKDWAHLCGLAVAICGGQQAFRMQANILKRLVLRYGGPDVEVMLKGAQQLGWKDLRSLGSKEGLGRRWAQEAYWQAHNQNKHAGKQLEGVAAVLKARGF